MKHTKSAIRSTCSALPQLRFEDQHLTSFSGLIVFQRLFRQLSLKARLRRCFAHCCGAPVYPSATIVLLLIVHTLLGYRPLRHLSYYRDDPLVLRLLGLSRLPHVATISRHLSALDDTSVCGVEDLQQDMVLEQMASLSLARVTLDFDGSVISTCRHAEGVAAGWNRKKRGQRSYYPLLCTVSQTAQVLAVKHRSGNVHDSRGAKEFILACIAKIRKTLPQAAIEVRMDSAFFSEETMLALENARVTYSISVPVDRYAAIKEQIERRYRWRHLDHKRGYFERRWRMKSWSEQRRRFVFVRQRCRRRHSGPLQLDMFSPCSEHYQYKIIVTNKPTRPANLVAFHDGRGAQEGVFAELKSHAQFDYVPTNTWNGNKVYLLANLMAHNLARTLQIRQSPPARNTMARRPPLWRFARLDTLRKNLIQRAGRLIRPQGKLTLSMANNDKVRNDLLFYLKDHPVTT